MIQPDQMSVRQPGREAIMAGTDTKKVFFSDRESVCCECGAGIEKGEKIYLETPRTVFCLTCVDLDHLVYLSSGDTALTTRARKLSPISEIVWSYSRSRKRSERQGVLVSPEALEKAQEACLDDAEIRELQRIKAAETREVKEVEYVKDFAAKIKEMYPCCPTGEEKQIAEHACLKYSNRVGRCASAKKLDGSAVTLAVRAHIRHSHTKYDKFLEIGYERFDARQAVADDIKSVVSSWRRVE
jgi:hypothetical protein